MVILGHARHDLIGYGDARKLLLRVRRLERLESPLELREKIGNGDLSRHAIAVDPSCEVLPVVIVDPKDRVAAPVLTEASRRLEVVQRVDENGHEGFGGFGHSWIAKRTAREVSAARSAGVLAEVEPHRFRAPLRHLARRVVVAVPGD